VNRVLLTGRLTRDPEMRALASGKHVTTFAVATNEYVGGGREKAEYHSVITWDRLADICAQYLGKGSMVAVEDRLQTRQWDDDAGRRQGQVRRKLASRTRGATPCSHRGSTRSELPLVRVDGDPPVLRPELLQSHLGPRRSVY